MTFPAGHFTHLFNGLVWRMEIDPLTSTLFAEIRNEQDKKVSFASADLILGKLNFGNLTTEERWLCGMEAAYDGVLLLHHYQSEGSPVHKGIIAINGKNGEVLWSDYNRSFDHYSINGPITSDLRIQPRKLIITDNHTGAAIRPYNAVIDLEIDPKIILPAISADLNLPAGFEVPTAPLPGNIIHTLQYNNFRIVSLHALNNSELSQVLYIFESDKQVFTDILNTGIQKLQPEAFILHHNHLVYLKNRSELNVINL
jgi:hypothetical protein